jgi:hypothetical protein
MRNLEGRASAIVAALAALLWISNATADDFTPPAPNRALVDRFLATLGTSAPIALVEASVPSVGCPADGQLGPTPAPSLPAQVKVLLPEGQSDRLAYYKAEQTQGVLAPRGWKCSGVYGSDGDSLIVAPPGDNALDGGKTHGEAVSITTSYGETSGRFAVATVAARLFPAARAFVEGVRAEGIADPKDFVFSPWPGDTLNRLSARAVGFLTPVGAKGLGDAPHLAPGVMPVLGVAFLTGAADAPDLTIVRVRPDAGDMELYPAIALNSAELGATTAPAVADQTTWQAFDVARFGCSAKIPTSLFSRPQPPPANGDGFTFLSPDDAALRLFGRYNILSEAILAIERSLRQSSQYASVAYRASGTDWLVQSGYRGAKVYYVRILLSADRHVICTIDIEYPKARRQAYDPLNGTIAGSLRAP